MTDLGIAILMIAQLLFAGAVIYGVYRWIGARKKRAKTAIVEIRTDGVAVIPLLATFVGLKAIPWLAIATNSLNPQLSITFSDITYRVILKRTRLLSEIETVDVRQALGTVNLELRFRGRLLTFIANVGTLAMARVALERLPGSVPLTPRARQVLENG